MTSNSDGISSIAVYVCTYKRNGPLTRLLVSLSAAAEVVQPDVEIAVVVIDDNPDGRAKTVVDEFDGPFIRGLHYRHSGAQNISLARNLGVSSALEYGDWVAMVDDDQTVVPTWFEALIKTCLVYDADAATGPVYLRYPSGAPSWLTEEPFDDILAAGIKEDGERVEVCSTGNSLIRGDFLRAHPEIRFKEELGEIGGEDMVFYREAVEAGLRAHYSLHAVSYGEQPPERSTFRHQLWACYWMGNTEYLTNVESGDATRFRMFLRGSRRAVTYLTRPARRLADGETVQWRFALGGLVQSFGIYAGVLGFKVPHH